ncbi:MAG: UMP kinase [Candidatus Diapherotrites archaeon]
MDMFEIFQDYAKEKEKEEEQEKKEESQSSSGQYSSNSYSSYSNASNGFNASKLFVISAGGSLFFDGKPDSVKIAQFAQAITELRSRGYSFVIVVGGGKTARNYVSAAKALGANNFELDEIGIQCTRLNASIMINALENAYPSVLTDVKEAKNVILSERIAVFGGLMPGITTDAVSALIAEYLGAIGLVNLTNVDGVYSADPKKSERAKFFPALGYEKLITLLKVSDSKPGQNLILDLPCALIIKRSKIKTYVLNGNDLENFKSMVIGMDFKGTIISEGKEEE